MAKKNDKNRKKKYIQWLKEAESDIRNRKELKATEIQSTNKYEIDGVASKSGDVCMSVTKVKKKNIKLDRKGKRRLNKLLNIKKNNTSMNL